VYVSYDETHSESWLCFASDVLLLNVLSATLELELIQTQMAQKTMLRAEVYARALRASPNVKRAEVWLGARCALWVGGALASAGVEGTRMGWPDL
jgi:hypothetical protein